MVIRTLFFILVCAGCSMAWAGSASNDSSCVQDLEWLIATFSVNDSGYSAAVQQKGKEALQQHNSVLLAEAQRTDDPEACRLLMRAWLHFFRSSHIGIRLNRVGTSPDVTDEKALAQFYRDFPYFEVDIAAFQEKVAEFPANGIEGIWQSGSYRVGITKDGNKYTGFIIEADGVYWHPKQIKVEFSQLDDGWDGVFYMRDHSPEAFTEVHLVTDNILKTGLITWRRSTPAGGLSPIEADYLEFLTTSSPYYKNLSDKTAYIRVPSFSYENKQKIEALLALHLPEIQARSNLIIDIRGNGGGSDASYYPLLPLLYTHPMKTIGVKLLSTPLNNSKYQQIVAGDEWDDEDKAWARRLYNKLEGSPGEFVRPGNAVISVHEEEAVLPRPERVGIIIDKYNASTAEQFLLASKQSFKTKLFGQTTMGSLDFANVHQVDSPNGKFTLWYATSISERLPDFPIDEIGLQPDYFIHQSIPEHLWVREVQDVLENPGR